MRKSVLWACSAVTTLFGVPYPSPHPKGAAPTWWECELQSLKSNIDFAKLAPKLNWIECFRLRQFRLGGFVRFLLRHKTNIISSDPAWFFLFFLELVAWVLATTIFAIFCLRGEDLRIWETSTWKAGESANFPRRFNCCRWFCEFLPWQQLPFWQLCLPLRWDFAVEAEQVLLEFSSEHTAV